ncbi:peptide deformylase [Kitasatospora sp. NPDC101801]|uniref:peptide deformylase n=1 Tax=Kitasatospora sp. NPDC101801 TaxID=3364103 RepID=UPI00381E621E
MVSRPLRMDVTSTDLDGAASSGTYEFGLARLVAQEIDHLDGLLCTHRYASRGSTDPGRGVPRHRLDLGLPRAPAVSSAHRHTLLTCANSVARRLRFPSSSRTFPTALVSGLPTIAGPAEEAVTCTHATRSPAPVFNEAGPPPTHRMRRHPETLGNLLVRAPADHPGLKLVRERLDAGLPEHAARQVFARHPRSRLRPRSSPVRPAATRPP